MTINENSKSTTAARILLGLAFTVFGLNGFLQFMPQPDVTPEAGAFLGALAAAGYVFPLVKIIEVVAGLALLSNRFVPLALLLLAPVLVNIVALHAVLDPAGSGLGIVLTGLTLFIAWAHRKSYAGVLAARAGAAEASTDGSVQRVPAAA